MGARMTPAVATIIASVISALTAIAVGLINSRAQHRKTLAELDKFSTLLDYRIHELEKKVDAHNRIVERTYELEKEAGVMDEKIRVANHRIDDLEKGRTQ